MDILADLDRRRLLHTTTDRAALDERLRRGRTTMYAGFDPSADSLHIGNLVGQLVLRRFQVAGHRPIVLAGGATGMIGDPGGRSEERNLLGREELAHNVARIKGQLAQILDFEPGPTAATLVDNMEWTAGLGAIEFLRDVGKHFTVNQMVARDSVRSRMEGERGISYTEFSYMLLQANDFRHLHATLGVEIQAGGSDQWGNIVSGVDLIRRTSGATVHAVTWPLVTRSDGAKMGKSASGAVWLDPAKTTPYAFRQWWVQVPDADVTSFLERFTLLPIEQIEDVIIEHERSPGKQQAQRVLADEVTTLVHGPGAARRARDASALLFGGDPNEAAAELFLDLANELPLSSVRRSQLGDAVALLVATGLATSNGDARRTLAQRGFRANGVVIEEGLPISESAVRHGRWLLLRKGKSTYHLVDVVSD